MPKAQWVVPLCLTTSALGFLPQCHLYFFLLRKCCVSLNARYHSSIHLPTNHQDFSPPSGPSIHQPSGHLCILWFISPPTIRTSLHPLVHLSTNHQDIFPPSGPSPHLPSVHRSTHCSMYPPTHTSIHPPFHSHTIKCLLKTCLVKMMV